MRFPLRVVLVVCLRGCLGLEVIVNKLPDDVYGGGFEIVLQDEVFDEIVDVGVLVDDQLGTVGQVELHVDDEEGLFIHVTVILIELLIKWI